MQLLYSDYTHIRQLVSDRRQRLVLQNVTFQKEAYAFFKAGIEQEELPSLEPYTSCFYDWFRGVMVEKEAELLQAEILDKPGIIKGTIIDDVFKNYVYICRNHIFGLKS